MSATGQKQTLDRPFDHLAAVLHGARMIRSIRWCGRLGKGTSLILLALMSRSANSRSFGDSVGNDEASKHHAEQYGKK